MNFNIKYELVQFNIVNCLLIQIINKYDFQICISKITVLLNIITVRTFLLRILLRDCLN
jgi:hypothetical protein